MSTIQDIRNEIASALGLDTFGSPVGWTESVSVGGNQDRYQLDVLIDTRPSLSISAFAVPEVETYMYNASVADMQWCFDHAADVLNESTDQPRLDATKALIEQLVAGWSTPGISGVNRAYANYKDDHLELSVGVYSDRYPGYLFVVKAYAYGQPGDPLPVTVGAMLSTSLQQLEASAVVDLTTITNATAFTVRAVINSEELPMLALQEVSSVPAVTNPAAGLDLALPDLLARHYGQSALPEFQAIAEDCVEQLKLLGYRLLSLAYSPADESDPAFLGGWVTNGVKYYRLNFR